MAFKKSGYRPLPLSYSTDGETFKVVGVNESMFTRKLSSEVRHRAEFHHPTWAKVSGTVKNAIYCTLQHYFDLGSLRRLADWPKIKTGIDFECARAYRGWKYDMHKWFKSKGGLNDLERSRSTPFGTMEIGKWHTIVDTLWSSAKNIRQSKANVSNRSHHRYTSSHGSSSYAQQLFTMRNDKTLSQENIGPIQVWYNNHLKKKPDDPLLNEIWVKIEKMRGLMKVNEANKDGSIDEVECLRRVLGSHRGFQPGVGRTLKSTTPDMCSSSSSSTQRTQMNQDVEERVTQLVNQQVSQYMEQIRAMNPSINFPTMPINPSNSSNEDEDEYEDEYEEQDE